jgi:hypothetical protein
VRGLGLLPYSNCVHYDAEPARRAEYHRFVAAGMRAGFAADDGVALHFRGTLLERAVSSRRDGRAYRVEPNCASVVEVPLEVTHLDSAPNLMRADGIDYDPSPGSSESVAPGSPAPGRVAREPIGAAT